MAHASQSEGVFVSLLTRFGLHDFKAKFVSKGWTTISLFAVSCGYNVDNVPDATLVATVAKHILDWQGDAEPILTNNVRQLFVHCAQAHLADLRSEFDPRGTEAPAKMHKFDRVQRRKLFKEELKEIMPEVEDDDMDPAWEPEDELYNMLREDELGDYMGPERFPSRRQEKVWKSNSKTGKCTAAGTSLWKMLTGEPVEEDAKLVDESVKSEMHLLEKAFKKRGILFHTVGLMSYQKHEVWRRMLWKAMRQTPTFAHEAAPGVADILMADKKIWLLLAEATLDGIQIKEGVMPLVAKLDDVFKHDEVKGILMVRPRDQRRLSNEAAPNVGGASASKQQRKERKGGSDADSKSARRLENQARQIENLKKKLQGSRQSKAPAEPKGAGRGAAKAKGNPKGKGRGKAKGKDDSKRKFVPMPKPLHGLDPEDEHGNPICFACNMDKGCTHAKWGEKCNKGVHKCMKCGKPHSYVGNH